MNVDIGHDPRTGRAHEPVPHSAPEEVQAALSRAAAAARPLADTPPATRAAWLSAIAEALVAHADDLVALADSETALGTPRLEGELARAAAQARFYGDVAAEGSFLGAVLDHAAGTPSVDLRRLHHPLGPVAVFGASNFPFGFGVVGHDTCSALAAGCPVIVKAHPAHPRTSRRMAEVVEDTLRRAGAPVGTCGHVVGFDAGLALVDAPEIAAVGFTGSQRGGMALVQRAQARGQAPGATARPIPVYAEMGTVNPVVVTEAAIATRADEIATGFADSFTLGSGQFCTKPGLMLVPVGSDMAARVDQAAAGRTGHALTAGIADTYRAGLARLERAGATPLRRTNVTDGFVVGATVLVAPAARLTPGSAILDECFGPVAVIVKYADRADLDTSLATLQPSLAAALHTGGPDDPDVPGLVATLSGRVGRVVVDGWPTGVAVTWSQHHGGPWPATSRPEATSVGAGALQRWLRPVTYQDVPDPALPKPLRDSNPWGVPRRVDGILIDGTPEGTS
ncbi:MAG: aldehyde dehydrogenase family protein [Mobilicoccus sp.]|nr:aldehyde dehydrogenase family protein [Mobilicoccus sp.]